MAASETPRLLTAARFNQQATHLAFATSDAKWRIVNCYPSFQPCQVSVGGCSVISMLFSSSLVALVGGGDRADDSPRRLKLWNACTQSSVFELTFASAILNVVMNKKRLLVVLEEAVHIFELGTMKLLTTLDTAPNPHGVCALSVNAEASLTAVLPSGTAPNWQGKLVIFDAAHAHPIRTLDAHQSRIQCVSIDYQGELMATASVKGTVVRVFQLSTGACLHKFRRGHAPATVHSLAFAVPSLSTIAGTSHSANTGHDIHDGASAAASSLPASSPSAMSTTLLVAASSTGTIHVWRISSQTSTTTSSSHDLAGGIQENNAVSRAGRKGLTTLRRLLDSASVSASGVVASATAERDFARIRLKLPQNANWCCAAIYLDNQGAGGQRDQVDHGWSAEGKTRQRCANHSPRERLRGVRAFLYAATAQGNFYAYSLSSELDGGGSCVLLDERQLTAV